MSSPETWRAPTAERPLDAVIEIPGSKSQTNRMLVLAALADSPSTIELPLVARDTELMSQALRAMGTEVTVGPTEWTVTPHPLRGPAAINCGLAGNVMRFGSAMAGLAVGDITLDGDPRARERPMASLLNALRIIGVDLVSIGGHLPVTVRGQGHVRGGPVKIDSRASSQFVTALLLSGCRFDEGLTLTSDGGAVPSRAHIDMTLAALRHSSVPVTEDGRTWRIEPAMPVVDRVTIEPDLSNAVPFLAAALLTAGRCRIPGIPRESVQPVTAVISLIEAFGGEVALDDTGLRVTGGRELSGVDLDMSDIGELVPVVTALAAVARSPSRIRGVAHLRGHETDRLAGLAREFVALGGDVTETADGLLVNPRPLLGGTFHTYDDHRMATTGALLGLAVSGIEVENVSTTAKTLPGFAGLWSSMLGSSAA